MPTAKWTINTEEKQDLRYPAARFNEKGRLLVWVWRCSKTVIQVCLHVQIGYLKPLRCKRTCAQHGDIARSIVHFVRSEIQRTGRSGFELCQVPPTPIELLELRVCCAKSNVNLHANFVLHLISPHGLYTLGLTANIQLYHMSNQHVTGWVGFFHPPIL